MAASMFNLLQRFQDDEAVTGMDSCRATAKVSASGAGSSPLGRGRRRSCWSLKEVTSDSVQNPSDPDAAYDGHKGQGCQVRPGPIVPDREPGGEAA